MNDYASTRRSAQLIQLLRAERIRPNPSTRANHRGYDLSKNDPVVATPLRDPKALKAIRSNTCNPWLKNASPVRTLS